MLGSGDMAPNSLAVSPESIDKVNKFGLRLLSLTTNAQGSNGLCALNIYHCLMIAASGSNDHVLSAFGKALGFDGADLDGAVKSVMQLTAFTLSSGAQDLSSASSAWVAEGFTLREKWRRSVETSFGAKVGPLQLELMNEFIRQETKGKFTDLVQPQHLVGVVLMLITCLYFKADWETSFQPHMTQTSSFHNFENKQETCSMMHAVRNMEYWEDREAQVCILPYKSNSNEGGRTGMPQPNWKAAVILPKTSGFTALQSIVSTTANPQSTINTLLSRNKSDARRGPQPEVNLQLPRFKHRFHLDLIESLAALGLSPAFQPSRGFSSINEDEPLFISSVSHDLMVEVNEQGTEMAAVTSVAFRRSIAPRPPVSMKVDRPFLFLVFDEVTKLVLASVVVSSVQQK